MIGNVVRVSQQGAHAALFCFAVDRGVTGSISSGGVVRDVQSVARAIMRNGMSGAIRRRLDQVSGISATLPVLNR